MGDRGWGAATSGRRAVALVAAVVALALGGTAVPASAETSVSVQTTAGSLYRPGRPIPVVVTISADGLTRGEVVARVPDLGDQQGSVRQAVEVPGGSTKRVVLLVESPPWASGPSVSLVVDGDVVARGGDLRPVRDEEPVAVFPELAARSLPESADLDVDAGRAVLFGFDPTLLAEGPAVLAPFTHAVATGDDLAALGDEDRAALMAWVGDGGRLLVDEAALTDDLSRAVGPQGVGAGSGDRLRFGGGEVVLTGGAVGQGDLAGWFRPTAVTSTYDLPFSGMWMPALGHLAADAGIRTMRVTGLLGLIGGYVVLVGPVLWFALRRLRRELLLWALVPAVAVGATAVVWFAGLRLRADVTGAHATLVVGDGTTSNAVSDVLLASPHGGRVAVALPAGWRQAGVRSDEFGGGPRLAEPTRRDDRLEVEVAPGSFGVFRAVGPGPSQASWEVETTVEDRSVVGRATNRSGRDLSDVVVFAGAAFEALGEVAAGATVSFELGPEAGSLPLEPELMGYLTGGFDGLSAPSATVAGGSLSRWLTEQGPAAMAPGTVAVLGWTRDEAAPLTTGSGEPLSAGRTGYLTRRPVTAEGTVSALTVRTELVRGPASTRLPGEGRLGFSEFALTLAHHLPAGASGEGLVLDVPARVNMAELWSGDAWIPLELGDGQAVFDLPPAAVAGGVVYTRSGLGGDFWGRAGLPHATVRSAEPGDAPLPVLAPRGSGSAEDAGATGG